MPVVLSSRSFGQDVVEAGTVTLEVAATALYGPEPGTPLAAATTDSAVHALDDTTATLDMAFVVTPNTVHDAGTGRVAGAGPTLCLTRGVEGS